LGRFPAPRHGGLVLGNHPLKLPGKRLDAPVLLAAAVLTVPAVPVALRCGA
jgi:hypothetical protein